MDNNNMSDRTLTTTTKLVLRDLLELLFGTKNISVLVQELIGTLLLSYYYNDDINHNHYHITIAWHSAWCFSNVDRAIGKDMP